MNKLSPQTEVRSEDKTMASPVIPESAPPSGKEAVNILIVDDEVRNLEVLESILTSTDYSLVRAQAAQEALLALIDGEFAAIVLDIQMPGTSGIELAHLIKQRKKTQHIPIIFLTAYFQEDRHVLQGYEVGAVDYLTKPINPRILKSKIAVFVELFQKNRDLAALNQAMEREIDQRQKAEEALRRVNNELEARVQERMVELTRAHQEVLAASRAKDDFLAALSHELRTPLNPVLLLASEAAEDPHLPPEVRAQFITIRNGVELEARLIDDLLDITRISHGKLLLNMGAVEVHSLLKEAAVTVRSELNQKRIGLTMQLAAEQTTVNGDAVRLQQVFWNVLKNAAKFTPDSGTITVATRTQSETGDLVIAITDSGIGMTEDELAGIFEAFTQGEHALPGGSHRFGGLGLGLAISRKLMESHSGSIKASSEGRNRGSTFTMTLPLFTKPAGAERLTDNDPSPPDTSAHGRAGALDILLVEDHEPTRTALAHLLMRRGYEVKTAASLAEARVWAGKQVFQLLISDIGLPDGNGFDLMRELRAGNPGLQGIALTGYGMEEDIARSRSAGFATHLIKPARVQALEAALASIVATTAVAGHPEKPSK